MHMSQYKAIYAPNHPNRNKINNCIYEHILVASEKLGRPLKEGEVVHHRDQNKENNKPENLIVFSSRAEHIKFHHYNCDESLLKQQEDQSYICIVLSKSICPICGEGKDKHSEVCFNCYHQYYNRKVKERPTREELKQKIRTTPFTQIGKEYNISDNAIRKWCKGYNLPSKAKEIKQYTEEEWENI